MCYQNQPLALSQCSNCSDGGGSGFRRQLQVIQRIANATGWDLWLANFAAHCDATPFGFVVVAGEAWLARFIAQTCHALSRFVCSGVPHRMARLLQCRPSIHTTHSCVAAAAWYAKWLLDQAGQGGRADRL